MSKMDNSIDINMLNNDVSLDLECCWCGGSGEDDENVCEYCEGTGYRLTDVGDAIINLVKRHLKK